METVKEWSVWKIIGALVGVASMIVLSGVEANPDEFTYNFTAMYLALSCIVIMVMAGALAKLGFKKWWMGYVIVAVYVPLLTGIMAFNWATSGMRNWVVGVPLIITYLLAVFMPFINARTAEFLHDELFAPTTKTGKIIVFSILAVGPIAGSFGVFLSGFLKRGQGLNGYMAFGILYFLFLCWGTVNLVYQAWEQRPWKDEK